MADMTWGEFKKIVEEKGAEDDDVIWYIDVSYPLEDFLEVKRDEVTGHIKVTG